MVAEAGTQVFRGGKPLRLHGRFRYAFYSLEYLG